MIRRRLLLLLLCASLSGAFAHAQRSGPKITVAPAPPDAFKLQKTTVYPWKKSITATVFWIGEKPTPNNPTPNNKSSWDQQWQKNYGGYDNPNPKARKGFLPKDFIPGQNPFYIALPYNDCLNHKMHKPEAARVIPWWNRVNRKPGKTVCKGRWVQIYSPRTRKICYAQWEDCGPFLTNDWEYVFGNQRPKNKKNRAAGIDISPAVRDFLGLSNKATVHWRFIEFSRIPKGPWSLYGANNPFINPKVDLDLIERDRYMKHLIKLRDQAQKNRR